MKNQKAEPNNNQTKAKTSNTKTIPKNKQKTPETQKIGIVNKASSVEKRCLVHHCGIIVSRVFNTIIQMEAGHLRENPQTHNSKKHFKQSPKGCKRLMGLLLAANNQATRRNDNKKLTSSGFKQQPICTPLAPTRNKIDKTACSDGPNSGSGKPSENRLKRASLVCISSSERSPQTD